MKTYEEINERIERKKAVVMTAEEIIGYAKPYTGMTKAWARANALKAHGYA